MEHYKGEFVLCIKEWKSDRFSGGKHLEVVVGKIYRVEEGKGEDGVTIQECRIYCDGNEEWFAPFDYYFISLDKLIREE